MSPVVAGTCTCSTSSPSNWISCGMKKFRVSFEGVVAGTSPRGLMKSEGVFGRSIVEGLTASNLLMNEAIDSFCPSVADRIADVPNARAVTEDDDAPRAAMRAAAWRRAISIVRRLTPTFARRAMRSRRRRMPLASRDVKSPNGDIWTFARRSGAPADEARVRRQQPRRAARLDEPRKKPPLISCASGHTARARTRSRPGSDPRAVASSRSVPRDDAQGERARVGGGAGAPPRATRSPPLGIPPAPRVDRCRGAPPPRGPSRARSLALDPRSPLASRAPDAPRLR